MMDTKKLQESIKAKLAIPPKERTPADRKAMAYEQRLIAASMAGQAVVRSRQALANAAARDQKARDDLAAAAVDLDDSAKSRLSDIAVAELTRKG